MSDDGLERVAWINDHDKIWKTKQGCCGGNCRPLVQLDEVEDAIGAGTAEAVNKILADVEDQQYQKAVMGIANEITDAIEAKLGVDEGATAEGGSD